MVFDCFLYFFTTYHILVHFISGCLIIKPASFSFDFKLKLRKCVWISHKLFSFRWVFGDAMCKIASYFTITTAYATTFFIAVMSLDRLAAVVFSEQSRRFRYNVELLMAVFNLDGALGTFVKKNSN